MERRPSKKKLSKNLLEMKFMKRTKEKTEFQEEEEVRARMFDDEISGDMKSGANRIVIEPSYVNIEGLRFGRMAFRGMNSEIESMMAEQEAKNNEAKSSMEMDVSDMEMTMKLSKTIGKKFATKRDNTGKPTTSKQHSQETASLLANTSNFLAQVRAETDQNKKGKPNFLKPPSD